MAFDAFCYQMLCEELTNPLVGGRIDKIHQPERDRIVVSFRSSIGEVGKLLFCIGGRIPRVQLTREDFQNPPAPPMFCMLLRKHLVGGRILSVEQPPMERILRFGVESIDELGEKSKKTLVFEGIGRKPNLILLGSDGRMIDCFRRVEGDGLGGRPLLPGLFYREPPQQEKRELKDLSDEELNRLWESAPDEERSDRWILNTFGGISPLISRELSYRACGETEKPLEDFSQEQKARLFAQLYSLQEGDRNNRLIPNLLMRDGIPYEIACMEILQYGSWAENREMDSVSEMLTVYCSEKEREERISQRGQTLIKRVTVLRDRTARKLENQRRELETAKDREHLRELGDIITANIYQMERGARTLTAINFFSEEGEKIEISLDPLLTPQQNAARYYRDYSRAKSAEEALIREIPKGERELFYLNSVLDALGKAEGEGDIREIRQELEEGNYLPRAKTAQKRRKLPPMKPMGFRTKSDFRISVGKNNIQNERLTLHTAGPDDIWLHVKSGHGSHVILWTEGREPDEEALLDAARLAVWYSQSKNGQNVPVDYTRARYVKKMGGGKPGMVIYRHQKTVYVTPEQGNLPRKIN